MKSRDGLVYFLGAILLLAITGLLVYTWWQGVKPLTGVVP